MLQYADDTLILLRADFRDVTALKHALDEFFNATSLYINFGKSTAVPMHVDDDLATRKVDILGCKREGFPQVYLGLPLSNEKLTLSAFAPVIAKIDCYLSGCKVSLLNAMGHTLLINSVLDSLLTSCHSHLDSSTLLTPSGVLSCGLAKIKQMVRAALLHGT